MSIRSLLLAGSALTAVAGLGASPAQASCIPATEREQLRRADTVFVGRVVDVRDRGAAARFRVLRVRKGRVREGNVVRVRAEPFPSSVTISWRPRPGQRWRVYADRDGRRWVTNDCMGTRRVRR